MKKADVILLKYGEIALKGLNKPMFERKLIDNIRLALADVGEFSVRKAQSTIYVEPLGDADTDAAVQRLKKVFGISNICLMTKCEKNIDAIAAAVIECVKSDMEERGGKTFKVESMREDKTFPMRSPEICRVIGGMVLKNVDGLKVDVHNPDIQVNIEVRGDALVYTDKIRGAGGMPVGTNGKAALLLSGGIDSPVAGYMISKRGVTVDAVHFHSHPYTSDRAKEKVIDLAKIISEYCGKINLHIVPFTDIQLSIIDKCPERHLTIIMRRYMMRIAERIAEKSGARALITGESIGQVASQTLEGLCASDAAVSMPVFRPCIGMDKEEIVTISKQIGTYETSILPYEDCCTIFVPKHPKTRPSLEEVIEAEKALTNAEELMRDAVENTEVIEIG